MIGIGRDGGRGVVIGIGIEIGREAAVEVVDEILGGTRGLFEYVYDYGMGTWIIGNGIFLKFGFDSLDQLGLKVIYFCGKLNHRDLRINDLLVPRGSHASLLRTKMRILCLLLLLQLKHHSPRAPV